MSGFKDSLTMNNYQTLIGTLTSQVAQQFEKVILKTNFNRVSYTTQRQASKYLTCSTQAKTNYRTYVLCKPY